MEGRYTGRHPYYGGGGYGGTHDAGRRPPPPPPYSHDAGPGPPSRPNPPPRSGAPSRPGPPSRSVITTPPTPQEDMAVEINCIKKNIICLCVALFILLTSFNGMASLESTLNPGAGSVSLACLYASMVVMSLFFSTWLINEISVKWAIFFGMWGYIIYVVAQFCPTQDGLIISGIVLGVGASPMWIAFSTYLAQAGKKLAVLLDRDPDIVLGQLFTFSHIFGVFSYVSGGFIASTILSKNHEQPKLSEKDLYKCGTNFCPTSNLNVDLATLAPPDATVVTTFVGVVCGLAMVAAYITAYFVDSLDEFDDRGAGGGQGGKTGMEAIKSNLSVLCSRNVFLLFVFCLWIGASHSYMVGDFNVAYIACRFGIHMIGYRVMIFAASSAVGCLLLIGCLRIRGRLLVFVLAGILNFASMGLMYVWSNYPHQLYLLYVIPVMWGLADSVWQTQVRALLASIYPEYPEEAFSALGLLESLGFVFNYALQPFMCNFTKIVVLAVMLGVGFLGYFILEITLYRSRDKGDDAANADEGSRNRH